MFLKKSDFWSYKQFFSVQSIYLSAYQKYICISILCSFLTPTHRVFYDRCGRKRRIHWMEPFEKRREIPKDKERWSEGEREGEGEWDIMRIDRLKNWTNGIFCSRGRITSKILIAVIWCPKNLRVLCVDFGSVQWWEIFPNSAMVLNSWLFCLFS